METSNGGASARSRTMSPSLDGACPPAADDSKHQPPVDGNGSQGEDGHENEAEQTAKQTKPRMCNICTEAPGIYKCSRVQCKVTYCSVACSRTHRDNHAPDPEKAPETAAPAAPATGHESQDPYRVLLDHAPDIKRLFKKYPNLKDDLGEIHRATLQPAQNGTVVVSAKRRRPWNRDEGLRQGAAALSKARTDPGEKGDGVREYCDLVLYLLSRPAGGKMASMVRDGVLAEETEAIKRLMKEESDHD